MPHSRLIHKLYATGINYELVSWIRTYQFVEIGGKCSTSLDVYSGVPQGSVLGPLLFLIYVNDIGNHVHPSTKVRLFADDCVLYSNVTEQIDQENLNSSLHALSKWCLEWGMNINYQKSVAMTITHKK